MTKISRILVICALTVSFTAAAHAATLVVNTINDTLDVTPGDGVCLDAGGQCSLRAAIGEANALAGDDIITLPAGNYTQSLVAANEDLNAGGDWDIRSNITINGAGSATTILQAAATPATATERVIENVLAASVVTINGVTLRHGNKTGAAANATRGGGIRNVGILTMNDSVVTLNNASGSGGVRNERTITLNNVIVSNNVCNNGGVTCFGGGMYNTLAALSTVTINGCTFTNNSSQGPGANGFGFGAGLGIESTTGFNLVITNSSFTNNVGVGTGTGGSNGNGIRVLATMASTVDITGSTFNNNSGTGGSSIQGVGIQAFTSGTGTLSGTWDRLTVSGNSGTTAAGAGFVATGGAMNITVRNSTISGNTSTGGAAGFVASNAGAAAGAASVINFANSTISGNQTNGAGGGGFIEAPVAAGSMTVNLNFCTIANNRANNDNTGVESGGGLFKAATGTVNLKNTIVGDNTLGTGGTAPDLAGTFNSQDFNHIEDLTGATITGTTTNNTTGDPQLGALGANGGPTNTHLPAGGSPVVNTIPNATNDCGTPIATDQRQLPRPSGGSCDKGSVEVQAIAAGPWDLSGHVRTSGGNGIKNVVVTLSGGGLPQPISVQTGSLGSFGFFDIPGGTYTLSVVAKRHTFTPPSRVIVLASDVTNENFTADPFAPISADPEK